MTKCKMLDGVFYLQKRNGCADRRMSRSMVVTGDFPVRLGINPEMIAKNEDGSWNVLTDEGCKVAIPGQSYWLTYRVPGEDPKIDVLEKGSLEYYDYNVCSESGVVIGRLFDIEAE